MAGYGSIRHGSADDGALRRTPRIAALSVHRTGVLTGPTSEAHHATAQIDKLLERAAQMHKSLAKHPLRWRLVALVAAYAIALSSLLASGVAARAAAELVAQSGGILCHTDEAGQAAPANDKDNNRICVDCCCVGCLSLMATVSLPQARIIVLGTLSSQVVAPLAMIVVAGSPSAKSHRSRAPPREAA